MVNAYAAEHLEVITADAEAVAAQVRHAGCVFVGPHSPVSLGDYCAGSNHVLPTGCTARHASGLSVQSFLRGIHVVQYDREALLEVADKVITLAEAEDLPAHGVSGSGTDAAMIEPGSVRASGIGGTGEPGSAAAARRTARPAALRCSATRRAGAAQHQREPVPAVGCGGG